MTTNECQSRDQRTIDCIESILRAHGSLRGHANQLTVSLDEAIVVLTGQLPTVDLKAELIPAIRKAGFLGRICDDVKVESRAA